MIKQHCIWKKICYCSISKLLFWIPTW